ncbi:D-apionate lactonase [Aureimonas pseudogalii]|uniref:Uncharacterized protein n=1 Tax=Aureimonas pseudogalii TaxID=1744844 RepID=A0A7W6MLA2_9HYPH|nr:hypothetical protein [Aureimonas pseudogalii]MBB3999597.1 hypothetical protein [Aureimonas pseudogalii]
MDAATRFKLTGTAELPPAVRRLAAGDLMVDLVAGGLRALCWRGVEVLRSVAYVVIDRDWGTYAPEIEDLAVEESEAGFAVRYRAACHAADGATLRFTAEIVADAAGRLTFAVEAVPDAAFETNRCGFCILHPVEALAGRPAAVTHVDGSVERSRFPDLIEPWQPFQNMRAIAHEVAAGVVATCKMEGDTFEMEDQRAWSDASYKTYVRPLALPWPYKLPAGETNRQRVVLEIAGTASATPAARRTTANDDPVAVTLDEAAGPPMPRFGVAVAPDEVEAALKALPHLRALAPRHLLLHFDPVAGHGARELAALARLADALPEAAIHLECVVPGVDDPADELPMLAALVRASGLRLDAVVVGPSVDRQSTPPGSDWPPCPPLEDVYRAARAAFPGVALGGGMFSYFTELNRKHVPIEGLDFVTHATCPIVHAADDLSVMQTLEALPFVTRSARAIIGPKPYHLGPTTIGMRQNPYGSRTMANLEGRRIAMTGDDPRQRGLFAASWLVGMAARLAGSDVAVWTGAAFAGPRGLLAGDGVVPQFHVGRALAALSGRPRLAVVSGDRTRIDGFAARRGDGAAELWLANLTDEKQTAQLGDAWAGAALSVLDAASFEAAEAGSIPSPRPAPARLALGPYAVARLVQ